MRCGGIAGYVRAGGMPVARDTTPHPPRPARLVRLRRRMLWASAPLVLLLVLAAVRLVTLNVFADQVVDTYTAKDKAAAMTAAQRLGWVNLVERWRYPFAVGDAHVVAEHEDLARPWFEAALDLVPKGGRDECVVRVNLALVYEDLGDRAAARERPDEARQFFDKGLATTQVAPAACDIPDPDQRNQGQELRDASRRMQEKNNALPPPNPDREQPRNPDPTPTRPPAQDKLDELQRQREQNQRDHENGKQDKEIPTRPPPDPNSRPW